MHNDSRPVARLTRWKPGLASACLGLAGLAALASLLRAQTPSAASPAQAATNAADAPISERGELACRPWERAQFRFGGVLGERLRVNLDNWLLRAPLANPGMLEMFRLRDRQPEPNLVPWAGEFVGKYLLSAVGALRLTDEPALRELAGAVVRELLATQAEDGYLGPFPQRMRLKGNWDLWGHYHCLEALLLWHELTGDPGAFAASCRAADLMCRTFLDQPLRVYDAGSPEMNMAVIHVLGQLHRATGRPRYLRLMREIEKDWERAGDYYRTGAAGVDFFATPRPRWESLHDLQGLLELYRITGEPSYRAAFANHWRSIVRNDRHNTGAFSAGEQATGDPYSSAPIETCCTVAWVALSVDMVRLAGDPRVADELELSLFNGVLGAQHPSGRWWTYNTPMDGAREASAHTIVFQARAGTPELNCCSVNGPRALSLLADWAVMAAPDGLVVNYHGPGSCVGQLADGAAVTLRCETDYPLGGQVRWLVEPASPHRFRLKLRIPAWSRHTTAQVNSEAVQIAPPGKYLELERRWQTGDSVRLEFDLALRAVPGDYEARGKVSLYRGPLLLAYDQQQNPFDEAALPALELVRLGDAKVVVPVRPATPLLPGTAPWLLVDLPTAKGAPVRLCDFASAGAAGARYRSWLPATDCPPPPAAPRRPLDGAAVPTARSWFKWTGPGRTNRFVSAYQLEVAETPDFARPVMTLRGLLRNRASLGEAEKRALEPGRWYFWRVLAMNPHGRTEGVWPPPRFKLDPALSAGPEDAAGEPKEGPNGERLLAALHGDPQPAVGTLERATGFAAAPGPRGLASHAVELDGRGQMLVYGLEEFPEESYSLTLWLYLTRPPADRLGQVFSAWGAGMDDPLRVCVEGGKLFARIEAGGSCSTPGRSIEPGRWHHVAAVKAAGRLTLYVDGQAAGSTAAPTFSPDRARAVAVGGNPRFGGPEFLAARFAEVAFFARALSSQEIQDAAQRQ